MNESRGSDGYWNDQLMIGRKDCKRLNYGQQRPLNILLAVG